jgi:hypothetical protein
MLRGVGEVSVSSATAPAGGAQFQRLPSRDGLGTLARLLIVADTREPAAQLDGSRKLATTSERGTDRSSLFVRHNEHHLSMEA